MHAHRPHKVHKLITWIKKNTSLVSGLAAVLITLLFVSSVVLLGQSGQLTSLSRIGAVDQTITYQEITCTSVLVKSNVGLRGNLVLNVMNSGERVVSQSAAFQLPFANETTLVRFPQLPANGVYTFFITQNTQVIGQNVSFNMMCPAPQVYFNNHTCNYVDLVSIQPLQGQFQVAVLFGSGEEGEPSQVVRLSQPFSFSAQNTARASFTQPLNSNDDFIYVLYRNGVFIAYGSGGGIKSLECYVPPTPTPTPNLPPAGTVDSITDGLIRGWARDPNTTAPIQV